MNFFQKMPNSFLGLLELMQISPLTFSARFCSAIKDGEIGKGLILYDYCIGCIGLIVVELVVIGQYIRCNCFFR